MVHTTSIVYLQSSNNTRENDEGKVMLFFQATVSEPVKNIQKSKPYALAFGEC